MKTSNSIALAPTVPSLFQIAAFFEDFFPQGGSRQANSPAGNLPFAELMVNPEKLMRLLKTGRLENHATEEEARTETMAPKRATRSGPRPARSPGSCRPSS